MTTYDFNATFYANYIHQWSMPHAERFALIHLLNTIRPQYSIEIGCFNGGSTSAISRFSQHVYSLDIDPGIPARLGHLFENVEFVIGRSQETLPKLLADIQSRKLPLEFILIDGAHQKEAVRQDCQNILQFQPTDTLYVIMHDSFNPGAREGIRTAGWQDNPHVQLLNLDFVPGSFKSDKQKYNYRQMWGGFALAVLTPQERTTPLVIQALNDLAIHTLIAHSTHFRDLKGLGKLRAIVRRAYHKYFQQAKR